VERKPVEPLREFLWCEEQNLAEDLIKALLDGIMKRQTVIFTNVSLW
jgi:hypothetical protein